ncbi:Hypothetical protein, putative [Bodo saltans]|uniref:Uncharacterized protein n=1 Tax=Bodo saltans TaxID=75058 RepID=A0A0S4ISC4_BODSA|nr:Hypothetical protein, putative [Bodo saltans]|eukprot:CUF60745.1 Hypothetical protein, putative [Bodo saltans]
MSERVANKLKQLTLAKRTTRERMQSLIETRMPSEGFTVDDFRELYSKHASLILALYQEFMTTVDGEATSKGKLLSTIEAGNVMFVLKDLMIYNASKIAHGDGWELPFFLKELPCFLHQETHIIVRRQGVDALATLISLRAAAAPAASSMEEGGSDGVAATLVPLMHLLLSSLDWEFLRTTYGSVTTLPNIISGDVRRGRHDCLPPRARYSATSNGADERLRETTAMLKRLIVESLTDKPDSPLSSPQALQLWTNYFHHHIAPLFTPTIALASGLVHGATLHGFLSGVHPVVHGVLVDLIAQLTSPQRDDLVKSGRLLQTIAATSAGAKFVIGILTEAVRNPSVETAAFNLKALTLWSTCLRQLGGAVVAETSTSFSTAAFVALPEVRQHVYWWLGNVLGGGDGDNTIHVAATLLSLQVQNCEASSATSSALPSLAPSPLVVLGSLQGLVEAYAEWMMLVASSGATSAASSVASASQCVPIAIREQAVNRLAVLAAELSVEAASKSSPHLDEVIPYTVQAFWVAAVSTVPLYGSVFLGSVHPVLCEMERRLKHTPSAAAATTALYMVRSWVAVVQHHVKVLIAPTHSKLVPFTWPSTSNTQSISGTAAASSPLLEYRLKRCPIIVEGATRAVASLLSGTFAQHAEVSPFVATFEAFHNLLANFEQDTYTTQQAKTSATVDALRVLIDHSRNWSGQLPTSPHQKHSDPTASPMAPPVLNAVLPIEPDSLLKVFAPYLLLQSRLSESSTSAKSCASGGLIKPATSFSSSVTSTTTPSGGSSGQRWMAGVAKDALETLCEIISLATAERWGPSSENEVETDNTLYDTESTPAAKPQLPMTPVLSAVVLDRLREVLHSIRSGELLRTDHLCGDVPGRMIAALFRNATTEILLGKPSSHFLCSTNAAMPYGMLDELEASALWVLNRFPTEANGAVTSPNSGDVFTAALTCLMWTLSVDRRAEAPLAPRASDFATSLRAAFTATASSQSKQQKQFILHLVKTTSLTVSMLLRSAASGNKETQSTGSADRARLQKKKSSTYVLDVDPLGGSPR